MSNLTKTKAAYTKPTLIEYGSLVQRTKILRAGPDSLPEPDVLASVAAAIAAALSSIFVGKL